MEGCKSGRDLLLRLYACPMAESHIKVEGAGALVPWVLFLEFFNRRYLLPLLVCSGNSCQRTATAGVACIGWVSEAQWKLVSVEVWECFDVS